LRRWKASEDTARPEDFDKQGNKKRWMELCEQAADEQDPKKLAGLILRKRQANRILVSTSDMC
jgi:hypothetical protein